MIWNKYLFVMLSIQLCGTFHVDLKKISLKFSSFKRFSIFIRFEIPNTNSEKFTQIQNWWSRQFMSIATCRGSIKRQKFLIQANFFCSFSLNVAVKFINKLQRHEPSWLYVFCEATRRFQNTWMLKNHKFGLKMLTHGLLCRIEWSIYIFVSIFLFER